MIQFKNKLGRNIDKKTFHYIVEVERINLDQKNDGKDDDLNDVNVLVYIQFNPIVGFLTFRWAHGLESLHLYASINVA